MSEGKEQFYFGSYRCKACLKTYTVNDSWDLCTPEHCHDCCRAMGIKEQPCPKGKGAMKACFKGGTCDCYLGSMRA